MDTCPRCKQPITGYPALSRVDNATNICSECGTREAMWDFTHQGQHHHAVMPPVTEAL